MIDIPAPDCQQCGGPLEATAAQTIIFTITAYMHGQGIDYDPPGTGWCGQCVADWNERMGVYVD